MESQNKKHPCDYSIVTPTTLAMYLAEIGYPNGRYRVRFEREARSDYRNTWTYDTDLTFYQASRLKTIWVEHLLPGGAVETIRQYALSYGEIFPGYTWDHGGKSFTLKSIQQLDMNNLGLPITEFSYGALQNGVYDGLHLTAAANGYGGTVAFAYEADPWRDVNTTPGKKSEQGNHGGCAAGGSPEGWSAYPGGWVGCEGSGSNSKTSANGAVYRQGDESLFQPGGVYRVSAMIKNNSQENSFIQVGIDAGQGVHVLSTNTLTPKNQAGSSFTFSGEYAVPANAGRVRLYVNCGMSCTIQDNGLYLLPTRYRVTSKTLTSSAPSASYAFNYRYDEPAMNDAAHSAAVVTPTPAPTPTPIPPTPYYPAYSEFRGHARVEESDPYGRVTTSYFHQDDARKGQVAMQLTTGRSFLDGFESFQSGWSHSGQGSRQTLERVTGDPALSSDNPANDWAVNSRRTAALGNGQAVWLQFRRGSGEATLAGEVGTLGTSSYRRWGLVIGADGALKSQWISGYSGGVYQVLETSLGLTATANAWYGLLLIFDCDRLYGRVWQRDNPVTSARFEQSPGTVINANTTWKYRQWVKNGRLWLDDYNEGRVYGMSQTDYETAAPVGASGQVSPELAIYWPHPVRSTTWNFEGDGQYTARKTEYQYALADQLNGATQHQYGNLTRQVDYSWNGSVWTAYRGERTWYYWTDGLVNGETRYLVGLPGASNAYACPGGVCDWGANDAQSSHQFLYDGRTSSATPPTAGVLTGERTLLRWDGANQTNPQYADVLYQYDAWGNRTHVTAYTGAGTAGQLATSGAQTTQTCYGIPDHNPTCLDDGYHTYPGWQQNALGHRTTWTYDKRYSAPTGETDPNGATTTAGYDTFGRMIEVTRPAEIAGLKTLEIDYLDGQTPYGVKLTQRITGTLTQALVKYYDGLGRVVEEQSLDAQVSGATKNILVYRTYDAYGQALKQSVTYEVSPGLSYRAPDTNQAYTQTSYDLLGRVSVVTGTEGVQERRLTYLDLEVQELDAKGSLTRTLLDVWGRTVQVIPPLGPGVSYAYDEADRLKSATYGAVTSSMQYDLAGRKTAMSDPSLGNWDYAYNALGSLTQQDDAKHQRTCLYYDTLNRLTKKYFTTDTTICLSNPTTTINYTYDSGANGKGQRTGMTDATGGASWVYDARGRMTEETKTITGSGQFLTSWKYNSADGVASMTYPGDNAGNPGEVIAATYTNQMQPALLEIDFGGGSTFFIAAQDYDSAGRVNLRKLGGSTSAPLLLTQYTYFAWNTLNGKGRLKSIDSQKQDGSTVLQALRYYTGTNTAGYDALGNLLRVEDYLAGGPQVQVFTYDALSRLKSAYADGGLNDQGDYASPASPEQYIYNTSTGSLSSKAGVSYTYAAQSPADCSGAAASRSIPQAVSGFGTSSYGYDCNGSMTTRTVGGATSTLSYDPENRLATVSGATTANFKYDGDGRRVVSENEYRNLAPGAPASSGVRLYNEDVITDGDTWANNANRQYAQTEVNGLQYVQIDLGAAYNVDRVKVWHYGSDGRTYHNTRTQVSADGVNWTTVFDSAVSGEYAETEAGKTITFATRPVRYVRDWLNGSTTNAGNHWVEIEVWGRANVTYVGDYFEWIGSTNTMVKYYTLGGARIAMRTGNGTGSGRLSYLFTDHLGSTTMRADGISGMKLTELRYKPWGESRYASGSTPTKHRYTGQISEESGIGLYYYGARFYDPYLNRWISPDSIVPEAVQGVQAWDRYAYTNNNPVRYTDPTGHRIDDGCSTEGCSATKAEIEYARQRYDILNCQNGGGGGCPDYFEAMTFSAVALVAVSASGPIIGAVGGTITGWLSGAATTACLDGNCTNEIQAVSDQVHKGITVLGRYPKYINVAKDVGGKVFSVSSDVWNKLSQQEQWALNRQFLDDAIARGDIFYLANNWAEAQVGSYFYMELQYLFSKGYTLSVYQNYLIPPSIP